MSWSAVLWVWCWECDYEAENGVRWEKHKQTSHNNIIGDTNKARQPDAPGLDEKMVTSNFEHEKVKIMGQLHILGIIFR